MSKNIDTEIIVLVIAAVILLGPTFVALVIWAVE